MNYYQSCDLVVECGFLPHAKSCNRVVYEVWTNDCVKAGVLNAVKLSIGQVGYWFRVDMGLASLVCSAHIAIVNSGSRCDNKASFCLCVASFSLVKKRGVRS